MMMTMMKSVLLVSVFLFATSNTNTAAAQEAKNGPATFQNDICWQEDATNPCMCTAEIESLCPGVEKGDGAVAKCLRAKNVAARARKEDSSVSADCIGQVREFFRNAVRSEPETVGSDGMGLDVSPVKGFRMACKDDKAKFCSTEKGPNVMKCLKAAKARLTDACRESLFNVQLEEAKDMHLDVPFFDACRADLTRLTAANADGCPSDITGSDVKPGLMKVCLRMNRDSLDEDCRAALFKRKTEDAADIRLNQDVFTACKSEVTQFCGEESFGEARMLKCLWEKKRLDGFSVACRDKVTKTTEDQESDFRLDYRLNSRCQAEIEDLCAREKALVENLPISELMDSGLHAGSSGMVITCLKRQLAADKLDGSTRCKGEVERVVSIQGEDAKADSNLSRKCKQEIQQFCADVPATHLHLCLRKSMNKAGFGEECKTLEVLQGASESKDIGMKTAMKGACRGAIAKFCKDVQHGQARVIRCLQDHMDDEGFPPKCREEVFADLEASNHDWELKFGISKTCESDMRTLCASELGDLKQHGVLNCLKRKLRDISEPLCKDEMKRFVKFGVKDINLDPGLFSKCVNEVQLFCPTTRHGEGRIHDCLKANMDKPEFGAECRKAEFEEEVVKSLDVRMNPRVMAACGAAVKQFCSDTNKGDGSMWRCLEDHIDDGDMPEMCRKIVGAHEQLKNANFNLNPSLSTNCRGDAQRLCETAYAKAAEKNFKDGGDVIDCLIEKRKEIKDPTCKASLLRKEIQRGADIRNDPKARDVCAGDIDQFCSEVKGQGRGKVHQCLLDNMESLSDACKAREFKNQEQKSQDIRFNPVMYKECKSAVQRYCQDVPKGEDGAVIECLLAKMHDSDMEAGCRKSLATEERKRAKNIQFNPQLFKYCHKDLMALKDDGKCDFRSDSKEGMQGLKIKCLTANRKAIKVPECRDALLKTLRAQSNDYRAKPGMEKKCAADINTFCKDVSPGEGRVHLCLREHLAELQSDCKTLVDSVASAEEEDATINPLIKKRCKNEMNVFCNGVAHGDKRLLACLHSHKTDDGFTQGCKSALNKVKVDEKKMAEIIKARAGGEAKTLAHDIGTQMEADKSFMELRGPFALAGMVSLTLVVVYGVYRFVQKRKSSVQGYTVVVPKNFDA